MIQCPHCAHHNLPNYPNCSKWGGGLGGPGNAGRAAADESARMQAQGASAAKRNRVIYIGLGAMVVGLLGWKWMSDSRHKADVQAKLDLADRWAELEKRETGLFWNCVMASEVDINLFNAAQQIQQRIEAAYATQQKTFADYLRTDCIPKIERARQAFAGLSDAPSELKAAFEVHAATLPKLQSGIEAYADALGNRKGTKDLDQLIQDYGNAWHAEQKPTPETVAFEKFMHCAVPGLEGMKDAQEMLEFLATACYKKDPVAFMDRVRKECGALLQTLDPKASPSKSYKQSQRKFYEEDARQLQAWDSCSRRSRKGKKTEDLEEFLVAVGEYMKARSGVAKAAKDLEASGK